MAVGMPDLADPELDQIAAELDGLPGTSVPHAALRQSSNYVGLGETIPSVPMGEPQQGGPGPGGSHTPDEAGSTPAPATPDFEPLGPAPAPPALTGDPLADSKALVQFHGQLAKRAADIDAHKNAVAKMRSERELAAERDIATRRDATARQFAQEREARQLAIDEAVTERVHARRDLESGSDDDKLTGRSLAAAIAGAIGAGFQNMAAAQIGQVGHAKNEALETIDKIAAARYAKKKARYAAAGDALLEARYGMKDAVDNRRAAMNDLDADQAATYRLIAKEAAAQLRARGVPETDIATDPVVVGSLDKAVQMESQIHDREADNAETKRHNMAMEAARRQAKGRGGGGAGGAATLDAQSQLATYAEKNPGDRPGLYRLAGELRAKGIKVDSDDVDKAIKHSTPTEGQSKAAEQATAGLSAVKALMGSKYTPSEADTQRWLNNQRDVYQAQEAGKGGGIGGFVGGKVAGGLQSVGLSAKSEVEGLSPEGKVYFANVRRLMEPLGRAKSGAAISQSEWVNFFNQYGPQSAGGYAAAERELRNMLKLSGVAGRQIGAPADDRMPPKDVIDQANAVLKDKDAPPALKEKAQRILDAAKPIKL